MNSKRCSITLPTTFDLSIRHRSIELKKLVNDASAFCNISIFSDFFVQEEQLAFLDSQLKVNNELLQTLKDNYRDNGDFKQLGLFQAYK